jgi:protocatechuate 3,4-dioxygenase beta subunit
MQDPTPGGPPPSRTYEGRPLARPDDEVVDQGLRFDVETLIDRRRALRVIGLGAGTVALAACSPATVAGPTASPAATTDGATGAACAPPIPEETAGPYPGDGSNGPDVLSESGVVRSDIRSSFGEFSGTAEGIPLTIRLAIQDASSGCAPYAGAAVYVWHCDRDARYSLYSDGATDQNYLRGVQAAGEDGVVSFQSIFPACYRGRWPHIHFEVYPSLAAATDDANVIATSQVALPEDACHAVYATAGYEASVANLQQISLATDNVFGEDGGVRQLGTVSGSVEAGYTIALAAPVAG